MTEDQWRTSTDPQAMLLHLRRGASPRKFRLFSVACCRHIWGLLEDPRSREAVEVGERYADGLADEAERRDAAERARAVDPSERDGPAFAALMAVDLNSPPGHTDADWGLAIEARAGAADVAPRLAHAAEAGGSDLSDMRLAHCHLIRDVFGNPFRPVAIDPTWRPPLVMSLARGIYNRRAFDRMPLLGELLKEAGCRDAEVLEHCTPGQGGHVRGCWLIDALLGRS
jgi:hypothetical protein